MDSDPDSFNLQTFCANSVTSTTAKFKLIHYPAGTELMPTSDKQLLPLPLASSLTDIIRS